MPRHADTARWPHAGAILAGGESRRMGRPKEGVRLRDGRAMIEPVIDALRQVCARVIIVGACQGFTIPAEAGILHLSDEHPGDGPLAGVESLLASGLDDRYLVVACDQPLLSTGVLRRLVRDDPAGLCVFDAGDGPLNPFPGVYPASWLPVVAAALRDGRRSITRLLADADVTRVPLPAEDARLLDSINTPEALKEFCKRED